MMLLEKCKQLMLEIHQLLEGGVSEDDPHCDEIREQAGTYWYQLTKSEQEDLVQYSISLYAESEKTEESTHQCPYCGSFRWNYTWGSYPQPHGTYGDPLCAVCGRKFQIAGNLNAE